MSSAFNSINQQYKARKRAMFDNRFIFESVTEDVDYDDETGAAEEDDIESTVDSDSVPKDVYKKIDAMLDGIITKEDYDDTEAEELLDDDDVDDGEDIDDDNEVDAIITEAAGAWLDAPNP